MKFQTPPPYSVHEIETHMLDNFDVNPFMQYCSVTGRPYGMIPKEEIESTIRFLDNDDLESFCDDLFVRMIAGMRPCLNWSRVEPITIEFARTNDPASLLSYLIHRCNESKPSADLTFADMMTRNQHRIKSYRVIAHLCTQVDVHEITQLLLQADTIGNLHRFTPPLAKLNSHNRLEPVKKLELGAKSLFSLDYLTPELFPSLVGCVRKWVESILEAQAQLEKVALSDARAAATYGNRLTSMAYSRSWMENPVSALTYDARKRREDKSSGKTERLTKKARAQAEIDDLFAQVTKQLTGADLATKIASTPKVQPKRVLRFGAPKQEA